MKHRFRHFPAFLVLLLPLAVLAWFGSVEFGRLEDRAARTLRDSASTWLRSARRTLERSIESVYAAQLDGLPELASRGLVETVESIRQRSPATQGLVLLGADGELVFPTESPDFGESLLFAEPATDPLIDEAEVLEQLGDLDGARLVLEGLLDEIDGQRSAREAQVRGHFMLARILRRQGSYDAAVAEYLIAATDATLGFRRDPSSRLTTSDATVAFLSQVAIRELEWARSGDALALVEIMEEVANGVHDDVGDVMLEATLQMLSERIADDELRGLADRALELDAVRRSERVFASEYGTFLQETVRRRLRNLGGRSRFELTCGPTTENTLLIVRRTNDRERSSLRSESPQWVGLRFDLERICESALAQQEQGDYALTLIDTDGTTLWTNRPDGTPDVDPLAAEATIGGMQVRAAPLDAERLMSAGRASLRNRAILILLLCIVAGAGAFFLVRSVSREAEIASLKVDLVSRVTHELKTPLALIKMYGETLTLGRVRDDEQAKKFSGIITREADHLARMIERVLDFSRQEAGTLTYEPGATDLVGLVQRVIEAYRPQVEARGCRLVDAIGAERAEALVDAGAFESSLVNLIENAVKYTSDQADDPSVEVQLTTGSGQIEIEVKDHGIGIPEGEHEQVFQGFFRASNAGEVRGAGLGLSLVHHFATAHEGTISARPRDGGVGTAFKLTLPLHSGTGD